VQLDHRRAQLFGRLELPAFGIDEQRNADVGGAEPVDERREALDRARGVKTALGGELVAPFGHQAGGVRLVPERDLEHRFGRRHFEIERHRQLARQARDVVVGDVAAVLAQMGGDAVGAGLGGHARGAHRIGMPPAARVADGGDVVDVDAEAERTLFDHGEPINRARVPPS
jgi:hypothetical protein